MMVKQGEYVEARANELSEDELIRVNAAYNSVLGEVEPVLEGKIKTRREWFEAMEQEAKEKRAAREQQEKEGIEQRVETAMRNLAKSGY
jgi:hypothetical protein